MFEIVDIEYCLKHLSELPIVDVRSPGEFEKGHIPGAFNIPLFSNEERAAVGTVYKQKSREEAIDLGYQFVTPKLEYYVQKSKEVLSSKGIIIHCWRGGMRSKSFAEHLSNNSISNVYVIENGYKAFRRTVLAAFDGEYILNTIGGFTGSGKTEILHELRKQGKQVIDLEGIAHHKGSAFGAIGQKEQPTVEQFENNLFWEWKEFDLSQPVWIEDESRNIGSVLLPQGLYNSIRQQMLYFLDISREERARYLVKDYGQFNDTTLAAAALEKISRKLGGLNTQLALEHLDKGEYLEVAKLALYYYDKSYVRGMQKRDPNNVTKIQLETVDKEHNANEIRKYIDGNRIDS